MLGLTSLDGDLFDEASETEARLAPWPMLLVRDTAARVRGTLWGHRSSGGFLRKTKTHDSTQQQARRQPERGQRTALAG